MLVAYDLLEHAGQDLRQEPQQARRALLDEFRDQVIRKSASSEDLVTKVIEPYAEAYLIAKNCLYKSTTNAAGVNALLKWLNRGPWQHAGRLNQKALQ